MPHFGMYLYDITEYKVGHFSYIRSSHAMFSMA